MGLYRPSVATCEKLTAFSGTGAITLPGLATTPGGYRTFATTFLDGDYCYFRIVDRVTGDWEEQLNSYTASGTVLNRAASGIYGVRASSNGNALVNFAGNDCDVFVINPWGNNYPLTLKPPKYSDWTQTIGAYTSPILNGATPKDLTGNPMVNGISLRQQSGWSGSADNNSLFFKAAPPVTTPPTMAIFGFTFAVEVAIADAGVIIGYRSNSGTYPNRLCSIFMGNSSVSGWPGHIAGYQRLCTAPTVYYSNTTAGMWNSSQTRGGLMWLGLYSDGANTIFRESNDGYYWTREIMSTPINSFLTVADTIYFGILPYSGAAAITLVHYDEYQLAAEQIT